MRYLVLALVFLGVPLSAAAQHMPSLPSIGLPLPPIGLTPQWERQAPPWWERQPPPSWERDVAPDRKGDRDGDRSRRGHRPVKPVFGYGYPFYVMEPYVVEVPQPPQIIYVEVPRREEREEPAPQVAFDRDPGPPPPYVPSGDRTVYVVPGCYVGNVPPDGVKLPAGCDASKVQVFKP
jgi:hypothetical protein